MKTYLHLSEATNLAIHALAYLHGQKSAEPISVGQIASALSASESHLSKVMQRMVHEGLIRSSRGARGGFVFLRKPETITLSEIVEIVEGPHVPSHCLLAHPICKGDRCKLQTLMQSVSTLVEGELQRLTLADVFEGDKAQR